MRWQRCAAIISVDRQIMAAILLVLWGATPTGGVSPHAVPAGAPAVVLRREADVRDAVLRWNRIAVDASGLDRTHPPPGDARSFGEQLGPGRASRAMAIVHIAIFEAINAVYPAYDSFTRLDRPDHSAREIDLPLAIAQAAHDTLSALYPAQSAEFGARLREDMERSAPGGARDDAQALGQQSARVILAMRADDGSQRPEPRVGIDYAVSDEAGHWRPDPISQSPVALGAYWGAVRPFVLTRASAFRAPPPPTLTSEAYAAAFAEVRAFGGDGIVTASVRTEEETMIGIYWAYDGMPSLCAPPRLYNQLAITIADTMAISALELARLLVLVNVAMADAGIVIWESKYFYDVWRPVTGLREAVVDADPSFTPLGAPASNLSGPNFTPPFPSYPSGHAGFGAALFQTLRRVFEHDDIAFTFVSDELNGITVDNAGRRRPLMPRSFRSLSEAEEENGQSRIYLGIHWAFDKTAGIAQGRQVADVVSDRLYRPRPARRP
jgi:hypothetical protein